MADSYDYASLKDVSLQEDGSPRRHTCAVWTGVVFFVLSLALAFLLGRETLLRRQQYAGDQNRLTPEFARHWVVFRPDRAYVPYNSSDYPPSEFGGARFDDSSFDLDASLVLWDRLQRDATIPVSRPEQYDLPEPIIKHGKSAYIISAFHQLHCLGLIFEGFQRLHQHGEMKGEFGHYSHCFDFLRQAIMCAGDTTLEGVHHSENPQIKNTQGADGWGATHNCRNWDDIKAWAKQRSI